MCPFHYFTEIFSRQDLQFPCSGILLSSSEMYDFDKDFFRNS